MVIEIKAPLLIGAISFRNDGDNCLAITFTTLQKPRATGDLWAHTHSTHAMSKCYESGGKEHKTEKYVFGKEQKENSTEWSCV